MKRKKAFTLIELLVVIAIIALLLAIVVPALKKAKDITRRIICKNNIRQQGLGIILYSEGNDGFVPNSPNAPWFWDMSFWATNEVMNYAGIDNKVFYCPSNRLKKPDDARYWQFTWVFGWGVNLTQPQEIRDESVLTAAQQRSNYRVMSYIYMFDKYTVNNGQTTSTMPASLEKNEKPKWISKIPSLKNTGSTIMAMDAVISNRNYWNFNDIEDGGAYPNFGIPDSTNHLSSRTTVGSTGTSFEPQGANIVFADGHAEWRRYDRMEFRLNWGQWWWW